MDIKRSGWIQKIRARRLKHETLAYKTRMVEAQGIAQNADAVCQNCRALLTGPYCHICGQRDDELRRPIWTFLQDLVDNAFSSDSRLIKTLVLLILIPGGLTRAYMRGQRARFAPPVRLYVIVSVVFFLVISVANVAILDVRVTPADPDNPLPGKTGVDQIYISEDFPYRIGFAMFSPMTGEPRDGVSEEHLESLMQSVRDSGFANVAFVKEAIYGFASAMEDPAKFNSIFNKWLPRAMFILVPLFALILRVFHWGKRGVYMHQLIFSLHFHSFMFILLMALIAIVPLWGGAFGMALFWWGSSLYLIVALRVAQDQGIIRAFIKAGFIWVSYYVIMLAVLAQVVVEGLREI